MQDFLDDLERRLAVAAVDDPELQRTPARRGRRRPAVLGGLTALLAAAAAAFTMTGTSLADLPILSTDTENAAHLAERADAAKAAGVDFSEAHTFGTPGGPGYALVNEETQTMCLVVPDPLAPGDVGQSCQRIADVERSGMLAELSGDRAHDPKATTLAVFVLPEDAEDVQLTSGGRRSTPDIESGIAVLELPEAATLSWGVDGRRSSVEIEGPIEQASAGFVCPDGRQVTAPAPAPSASPAEATAALEQLRKDACK